MINYKNYVGCKVEIIIKDREIVKGTLFGFNLNLAGRPLYIYMYGDKVKKVNLADVTSFKATKKAEDLTLKEWMLYFKNKYDSGLEGIVNHRNGIFRIDMDHSGFFSFLYETEIDMLEVYEEETK